MVLLILMVQNYFIHVKIMESIAKLNEMLAFLEVRSFKELLVMVVAKVVV